MDQPIQEDRATHVELVTSLQVLLFCHNTLRDTEDPLTPAGPISPLLPSCPATLTQPHSYPYQATRATGLSHPSGGQHAHHTSLHTQGSQNAGNVSSSLHTKRPFFTSSERQQVRFLIIGSHYSSRCCYMCLHLFFFFHKGHSRSPQPCL